MIWNVFAGGLILLTFPALFELTMVTLGAVFSNFKKEPLGKEPITALAAKIAVIIPAYNEEIGIQRTIQSLKSCQGLFEIIVIADNCTDLTASKARECNVRVLVRSDTQNQGKDHALHYAFDILLKEDFDYFLIVDADTVVSNNLITEIQKEAAKGADAIQVFYGVLNAEHSLRLRLMKISYLAINYIRPLGRQFWGFSAGIFGNGVAFSRSTLERMPFVLDSIVEDLLYHLMLVKDRKKVRYLSNARVLAEMPLNTKAMANQRLRWEGGRLKVAFQEILGLLKSLFQGDWRLIEPCLDLLTPPLSYLVAMLLMLILLPVCFAKNYGLIGLAVVFIHLLIGMIMGRCEWKDYLALAITPLYLVWKLLLTGRLFKALWKKSPWNRTQRPGEK